MRLRSMPSSLSSRAVLAGAATIAAVGSTLIAVPAAQAAAIRPATTTNLICIAESAGQSRGTVDCYVNPGGGVAPYTVTWAETGATGISIENQSELLVFCNPQTVVIVTATVKDSTGASAQTQLHRNCVTGTPIP